MPPRAAPEQGRGSGTLRPSRWMSRPTNAATTTDPMVLTSRISPRSPTGAPKLWRIDGQAVPSIPSGRPKMMKVPRPSRSNLRPRLAGLRLAVAEIASSSSVVTQARSDGEDFDAATSQLGRRAGGNRAVGYHHVHLRPSAHHG